MGLQWCTMVHRTVGNKLKAIMFKIKLILRQPSIPYKRVEQMVGKLRSGLPVGYGIYAPFNRTFAVDPKMVVLVKK